MTRGAEALGKMLLTQPSAWREDTAQNFWSEAHQQSGPQPLVPVP